MRATGDEGDVTSGRLQARAEVPADSTRPDDGDPHLRDRAKWIELDGVERDDWFVANHGGAVSHAGRNFHPVSRTQNDDVTADDAGETCPSRPHRLCQRRACDQGTRCRAHTRSARRDSPATRVCRAARSRKTRHRVQSSTAGPTWLDLTLRPVLRVRGSLFPTRSFSVIAHGGDGHDTASGNDAACRASPDEARSASAATSAPSAAPSAAKSMSGATCHSSICSGRSFGQMIFAPSTPTAAVARIASSPAHAACSGAARRTIRTARRPARRQRWSSCRRSARQT